MGLEVLYKKNYSVFLSFLIIGVFLYFFALKGPFVFDDSTFIVQNKHIQSYDVKSIYSGCLTDGAFIGGGACNFYRPNQALIHAVVFHFVGLKPFLFHFASLFFHIINAFLVFVLLVNFNFSRFAAFFASLVFLVHPMQTEAVSYISGLCDPLALCCMLVSFFLFYSAWNLSFIKKGIALILSLIVYVLALLSKESAVTLSVLLFLPLVFGLKKLDSVNKQYIISAAALFLITTICYLYLKFSVFNFTGTIGLTSEKNVYTESIVVRIVTFIHVLPNYFLILFFPFVLFIERPYEAFESLGSASGVLGMVLLLLVFIGCIYKFRRKSNISALAFCWFFIALTPVSGIIPINAIYLEHWLYIPSVGLIFLLAHLLHRWGNKNWVFFIFSVFLVFFSARTVARNYEWADAIRFYKNEIKHNPKTARIFNNLAMEYAERKMFNGAIVNYQKAIQLYDVYPQTHHNLARVYEDQGRIEEAVKEYYIALYMSPSFTYSQISLAKIYEANKRMDKATVLVDFYNRTVSGGKPVTQQEVEELYKAP